MANSANLALYIHIPFCIKRCSYCDYYSVAGASPTLISRVLREILNNVSREMDVLKPSGISTIFIGGGTPSLLPTRQLFHFLKSLNRRTGYVEEITIEANPESVSPEFIQVLNMTGVNRLSMGAQTYNNRLLNWLGRPAGREILIKADELLKTHWTGRLNRDILASLPREPDGISRDITQALKDDPGHISVYELTLEPGTPLEADKNRLKELPSEREKLREWNIVLNLLAQRSYRRYEISNFAKPGHICLHNMNYWMLNPYLGIGPTAASTVWNDGKAERRKEPGGILDWLEKSGDGETREFLSTQDFMLEHFIMGLRTDEGLSMSRFANVFGCNPVDVIPSTVDKLHNTGLLCVDSEYLRLSSSGMDLLNSILSEILVEIDTNKIPDFYDWPPS